MNNVEDNTKKINILSFKKNKIEEWYSHNRSDSW